LAPIYAPAAAGSDCEWVDIPTAGDISRFSGNYYFSPDTKPEVITAYFRHLENILYTNIIHVILLGDFNTPGFNWEAEAPLPKCHYY
jgi:hypothetical protein